MQTMSAPWTWTVGHSRVIQRYTRAYFSMVLPMSIT
jgi:hypothetical protein